jgi:hypothetical protein
MIRPAGRGANLPSGHQEAVRYLRTAERQCIAAETTMVQIGQAAYLEGVDAIARDATRRAANLHQQRGPGAPDAEYQKRNEVRHAEVEVVRRAGLRQSFVGASNRKKVGARQIDFAMPAV